MKLNTPAGVIENLASSGPPPVIVKVCVSPGRSSSVATTVPTAVCSSSALKLWATISGGVLTAGVAPYSNAPMSTVTLTTRS